MCEVESLWQAVLFQGKPMVGMLSSTNFDFNLILTFLGLNMWIYPIDACSPATAGVLGVLGVLVWAAHLEAWLPFDRDCCYHSVALPANFVTWTVPELQKGILNGSHMIYLYIYILYIQVYIYAYTVYIYIYYIDIP